MYKKTLKKQLCKKCKYVQWTQFPNFKVKNNPRWVDILIKLINPNLEKEVHLNVEAGLQQWAEWGVLNDTYASGVIIHHWRRVRVLDNLQKGLSLKMLKNSSTKFRFNVEFYCTILEWLKTFGTNYLNYGSMGIGCSNLTMYPHSVHWECEFLCCTNKIIAPHPPYSLALAFCNFILFKLKIHCFLLFREDPVWISYGAWYTLKSLVFFGVGFKEQKCGRSTGSSVSLHKVTTLKGIVSKFK